MSKYIVTHKVDESGGVIDQAITTLETDSWRDAWNEYVRLQSKGLAACIHRDDGKAYNAITWTWM